MTVLAYCWTRKSLATGGTQPNHSLDLLVHIRGPADALMLLMPWFFVPSRNVSTQAGCRVVSTLNKLAPERKTDVV